MTPEDPETPEEQLAERVVVSIKSALGGDQRAFADLIREYSNAPSMLGLITATAATALLNVVSVQRTKIKDLEARPSVQYQGVHDTTKAYQPGDFVTASGSLWACLQPVVGATPGDGSPNWKLAVKCGRPGRDGKDLR